MQGATMVNPDLFTMTMVVIWICLLTLLVKKV